MIAYILRRALYAIPILIGVNLITFALFFVLNSPDDMARLHLGAKSPPHIEVTPSLFSFSPSRIHMKNACMCN